MLQLTSLITSASDLLVALIMRGAAQDPDGHS
jgi:hypothetical protein